MTSRTAKGTAFLTDVYTCALEGGIGYWATCSSYCWAVARSPGTDQDRSSLMARYCLTWYCLTRFRRVGRAGRAGRVCRR